MNKIVAFTGHRTYCGACDHELRNVVARLYERGARIFRVGMAEGFDLAAAEAVVGLKQQHPDIVIEAYIPWPEFATRFIKAERQRYEQILQQATIIRYTSQQYRADVFHRRNDMLVDGAHTLVAWCHNPKSGTGYTLRRAKRSGCLIINLCEAELFDATI
ncbi:MAG: DUF1273 family protein [Alistipes sp.]|nr:DUF1273 family protein [Alistipes sp.]